MGGFNGMTTIQFHKGYWTVFVGKQPVMQFPTKERAESAVLQQRVEPRGEDAPQGYGMSQEEIAFCAHVDKQCPRVWQRMECPECDYPYSEAFYPLNRAIPHIEYPPC
jgi:hypothetical protein